MPNTNDTSTTSSDRSTNLTAPAETTSTTIITSSYTWSEGTSSNTSDNTTSALPGGTTHFFESLLQCLQKQQWDCIVVLVGCAMIGFVVALALTPIARKLFRACGRSCKKSPSDTEDDGNKRTELIESETVDTLHSKEPLGSTSSHPPTYELVTESAQSPYAEVNEPEEMTNTGSNCLYSEVSVVRTAKPQSVKTDNVESEEGVSAERKATKLEPNGNEYDDVTAISAAGKLPIQAGNTCNNYELATTVEDTVAPVYSDVNHNRETTTQDIKPEKLSPMKPTPIKPNPIKSNLIKPNPIKPNPSPFAKNYADTIKSLGEIFKFPANNSKADTENDIYDDAAIVKMNDNQANAEAQCDGAGNNLYEDASTVKLEKLADLEISTDSAPQMSSKVPSKGNHKHGVQKEMLSLDEDMTLVENSLYC